MLKMFTRVNYKGSLNLQINLILNLLRQVITSKPPIFKPSLNWKVPMSSNLKPAHNPSIFLPNKSSFLMPRFVPLEPWLFEKQPPQFPLEVKSTFFSFRSFMLHHDPWMKPNLLLPYSTIHSRSPISTSV